MKAGKPMRMIVFAMGLLPISVQADGNLDEGQKVYEMHCLSCHQADGGGVPMMQPELWASSRVNGPTDELIRFIMGGSQALSPDERQYDNQMPAFTFLSNDELTAVINYVRSNFDNEAPKISTDDVAEIRDTAP